MVAKTLSAVILCRDSSSLVEYLSCMYAQTGDEKYRKALARAIRAVLLGSDS